MYDSPELQPIIMPVNLMGNHYYDSAEKEFEGDPGLLSLEQL